LAIIAEIAPTSVEFQIHHVVHAFQVSVARKLKKKKCNLLLVRSAAYKSGIHTIKIRKVKGETGHAAYNNIPERIERPVSCNFFNQKNLSGNIAKVW